MPEHSPQYNPSQQQAINHVGPPLLLVAGAGSGKTATLVGRVTKLVNEGVKPSRILMLTFTNKAAKSMLKRAEKALEGYSRPYTGEEELNITAGTFHSIAYQFLHRFGNPMGFFRGQYVLGEYQTKRVWEKVYQSFPDDVRSLLFKYRLGGTSEMAGWYSQYITGQMTVDQFIQAQPLAQRWEQIQPGVIQHAFSFYEEQKRDLGGMDFDDILVQVTRMLTIPDILKVIKPKFDHILVDEYQDTSRLQAQMLKALAGDGENLVVVGDPKQSIYHFLAAEVTNITRFTESYPNAVELTLLENYRSTGRILALANQILEGSKEVPNHHLKPTKLEGVKPHVHKYGSDRMEARGILRDIQNALNRGVKPSEIAVLSRLSSLTYHLERELVDKEIDYVKVGGLKLMNKLNIRQFIAFLELALDRYNWLAWETILPMIPLIGKELSTKLLEDLRAVPEWEWDQPPPLSIGSGKRWFEFQKFWRIISQLKEVKTLEVQDAMDHAFKLFSELYEIYWNTASDEEKAGKTGLFGEEEDEEAMGPKTSFMEDRLDEIKEYIVDMTFHRTEFLKNFLDRFKLDDSLNQIDAEEKITLSTIHSAKGLEWDVVIICGVEADTLPSGSRKYGQLRAGAELPEDAPQISSWERTPYLEEEKRLFYVACTRAREELHLTFASQRRGQGRKDSPFLTPFKPAGTLSGTMETPYCTFTYEKMRTEEENAKFDRGQKIPE